MGDENKKNKLVINTNQISDNFYYDEISLKKSLEPIVKQLVDTSLYVQKTMVPVMEDLVLKISNVLKPLVEVATAQLKSYTPYFKDLAESIEKAQNNPDSLINWYNYSKKLSEYLWTIPYDIESCKLKEIFEIINSEKEFDSYMIKYFNKKKTNELFDSIEILIPKKHKVMFSQIRKSFNIKLYSLSIVGIMSIIDELCSYFLIDKGCGKRNNLFVPIINDLKIRNADIFEILGVMILNENINIIYDNINFNDDIKIKTHKKARRNPCQHGRKFSNRKIDVIMLLNTMFNLLMIQNKFTEYKSKLYKNNKNIFYIPNAEDIKKIKKNLKK